MNFNSINNLRNYNLQNNHLRNNQTRNNQTRIRNNQIRNNEIRNNQIRNNQIRNTQFLNNSTTNNNNNYSFSLDEEQQNLLNIYTQNYNHIANEIEYLYSRLDIINENIFILTSNINNNIRQPYNIRNNRQRNIN